MKYFRDILKTLKIGSTEYINLTKSVKIKSVVSDIHIEKYEIRDGMTLDTISNELYGEIEYWWVVAVLNDIVDPFYDLPLTDSSLRKWFAQLLDKGEVIESDWSDFRARNNAKREINVLKPKYLQDFIYLIERKINE